MTTIMKSSSVIVYNLIRGIDTRVKCVNQMNSTIKDY